MESPDITIAITSCGRFNLLKKTILSLSQSIDLSLYEKIMTEDSRDETHIAKIKEANEYWFLKWWKILYTGWSWFIDPFHCHKAALTCLYNEITTPFTFHCEDDWYFKKTEFDYIELSKDILLKNTHIGIIMMTDFFSLNERNIWLSREKIIEQYFSSSMAHTIFWHKFLNMKDYDSQSVCYSLNPWLRRTEETKTALTYLQEKVDEYILGKIYKEKVLKTINFFHPICQHSWHIFLSTRFFKDGFMLSLRRAIKNAYKYYFTSSSK